MRILTSNGKRVFDAGNTNEWQSIYSTILVRLGFFKENIPLALRFFEKGFCSPQDALETARQFNLVRDQLAQIPPEQAVWDTNNPNIRAPWADTINPIVTSCANLYTTSEGQDLLFEIVSILCYAAVVEVDVLVE